MVDESTPVTRALDLKQIPYRLFRHAGPIHSLEQAASERGQRPEQIVRSILFRISEDSFVMVLVAGESQVDWRTLRHLLGQSLVTMASEQEIEHVTGFRRGAVSPFGLSSEMRILVDRSALIPSEISIGSGIRGTTIIMRTADFERAIDGWEVVNIAKNSAS